MRGSLPNTGAPKGPAAEVSCPPDDAGVSKAEAGFLDLGPPKDCTPGVAAGVWKAGLPKVE